MKEQTKERLIASTGSISGATSVLGSWQVCHSICLGIVAMLGVIGITVTGMPLLFLTKVALPLWTLALVLLGVTIVLYFKKHCISKNLIVMNTGLIIAGTPLKQVQSFSSVFLTVGGAIAATGIFLFIREKIKKKGCMHHAERKK
ncbi:hypothetical protein HYV84_00825 [Candidatus Woesearchaeota archaeon]|nr:hypothetical protein [Candidatus Woesearchaeota archaeon]